MTYDMTIKMVRAALIAAIYVALTLFFHPFSFAAVQVRISEALTLLPFIFPEAVPGVFVGCLVANLFGGVWGIGDVLVGSLATFLAAWLTSKAPSLYWAALPPVLINALAVGSYIAYVSNTPYYISIFCVGVGQTIACYALGVPLVRLLQKMKLGNKDIH